MRDYEIIAIDPGKTGGIAAYIGGIPEVHAMPDTPADVIYLLSDINNRAKVAQARRGRQPKGVERAYMEHVTGFIQGKEGRQPGSAMFNFGRGVGGVEMALLALEIPTVTVAPTKWQGHIGAGSKASYANDNKWKNHLKSIAQRLFPSIKKITLNPADSLLILHYGAHHVTSKD